MKIIQSIFLCIFFLITTLFYCSDFLKQFVKTDSNQKFFVGVVEEKQKVLDEFTKEQAEVTASH